MRATRLSKLWLKALRTDSNTIGSVPLNLTKITGQTANFIEVRDTDDSTILYSVDVGGSVTTNGGKTLGKIVTVPIASADITGTSAGQLGHANGYPLVADPGTGKAIEFVGALLSFTYSTAQYTGGGNITINIGGGGAALTGLISFANSLGAAADKLVQFVPLAAAAQNMTVNKGINLVAASAPTQPGTAAGTVKVFVTYRVHTL